MRGSILPRWLVKNDMVIGKGYRKFAIILECCMAEKIRYPGTAGGGEAAPARSIIHFSYSPVTLSPKIFITVSTPAIKATAAGRAIQGVWTNPAMI